MGRYDSKIREQETAVIEARYARADANFSGDTARASQAQAAMDYALENISALKAMEEYGAED